MAVTHKHKLGRYHKLDSWFGIDFETEGIQLSGDTKILDVPVDDLDLAEMRLYLNSTKTML